MSSENTPPKYMNDRQIVVKINPRGPGYIMHDGGPIGDVKHPNAPTLDGLPLPDSNDGEQKITVKKKYNKPMILRFFASVFVINDPSEIESLEFLKLDGGPLPKDTEIGPAR